MHINRWAVALSSFAALAGTAAARPGPDVTLQDIPDIQNAGAVGTMRGYAIGSGTCNIGTTNLAWLGNGTPGLAMNAYRVYDGRITQIGLGWVKTACCAGASSGCGTCNGAGGNVLGVGCKDTYSGSWNGIQSRLAPRSAVNGYSGAFGSFAGTTGDAIYRRIQIQQSDLTLANFPGAVYLVEGIYAATDDAAAGNSLNNATYKRVSVDAAYNLTPIAGSQVSTIPAIRAWRDHGLGVNVPDLSVTISQVNIPGEGQFWYGYKARDLGNGNWRYDYAVLNLNSDRAGGSFSIPVPAGVNISNIGFSAPLYHSGELYSNAPWTISTSGGAITWSSPETFAQNPNTNALRWGTMYNFWFDASTPPADTSATLGLFKPFSPQQVGFIVSGPTAAAPCYANCDGSNIAPILNVNDFTCFLNRYAAGDSYANCDGSTAPPLLNVNDFNCFVNAFSQGCP